jgi:hypothetical protein
MRCQASSSIGCDRSADGLDHPHPDRVLPAGLLEALEHFRVPKPRVGTQQLDAGCAGPLDAGDQLLAEAQHPLLGVRRSLAQADVQRLARVRPRGEDRVVAQQPGVAVGGALLEASANLADEAVDIDYQPPVARAGPGLPRPHKCLTEQRVELAHVPERERPQKRSQRRRCWHPATQQPAGPARPEHAAVLDAVRPEHHREQDRHHLAARVGRSRPVATQPHQTPRQRLDPEAPSERRDEHHPGITDNALIVELDLHAIQSDRLVILHHEGDLLSQAPAARYSRKMPAQEVILLSGPDGTALPDRWIRAKSEPLQACSR